MKKLIVSVQDKRMVDRLKAFCSVFYVSKFINVVGVEIKEDLIPMLKNDSNVIDFHESEEGNYQPA